MRTAFVAILLAACVGGPVAAQPCRSQACTLQLPGDSGALDVRAFGAKGDGTTDDTAAILAAIAASGGDTGVKWWHDRLVYLPAGTYLVSDTLLKRYATGRFASGLSLLGEGPDRTIIRLADRAARFQNADAPRGVVMTTSKLIDTSPNRDYLGKGEGNDAYMNFVENLTIDVGDGNPGAIGIDYLANNLGAIRNVAVRAQGSSGAIGISMLRKFPGPALIQSTTVTGFNTGIAINNGQYGMTLSDVELNGQRDTGLRNDGNIISAERMRIVGAGQYALRNQSGDGMVTLVDSDIGQAMANGGVVVFRDSRAATPGTAAAALPNGVLQRDGTFRAASPRSWTVPRVSIDTVDPGSPRTWVGVTGSTEELPVDATAALQRALNSGASTVYLRHGTFWLSGTVTIPASVRRIVGMNSTLRVFPARQPAFRQDQPMLLIAEDGEPLQIDHLAVDNADLGDQLGIRLTGNRSLLLRDILSIGVMLLDRTASGGPVALENFCCAPIQIAGTAPVTARQFNTEGGGVRVQNVGAPLSLVGVKSEQEATVVTTTNGGQTDVLGGMVFLVNVPSPNGPPIFVTRNASLSAAFVEEVLVRGHGYRSYLRNESGGVLKEIPSTTITMRGFGRIVGDLSTEAR